MFRLLFSLTAVVGFMLPLSAADEETVPLEKVPKAVMDAVKARFPGGEVKGAAKEVENGKTVFEINLKHNGHVVDATLTPEGELVTIEKEIASKDLPAVVAKSVETAYPKATWKKIEEVIKVEKKVEKLDFYEILLVTADKKELEVVVSPEGKITKEEKKDGKEDK
jgi:hypothetical protein